MQHLWHPFTAMQDWTASSQISIESAQGNYLIDHDGSQYLDGTSSLWTNVHGHNHPTINEAIVTQVGKISHSTLLGLSNPVAETLAERLVDVAPSGLNHIFFSDSGSSAVEIALKQAFQYWQHTGAPKKTNFVHLDQAYHGDTLGAVSVGGIDLFHQVYGPLLSPTLSIPCPNGYFASPKCPQDVAEHRSLQQLEHLLIRSSDTIAALILEPLAQGAGGILTHSTSYLASVAQLCSQHEVLLIVDEVATGFGRTGSLFACEQANISPDFLCLAKGITGGYLPLAATLSTSAIYEAFLAPRSEYKTFFHGHTYTGNALACAAAIASLQVFEDEDTISKLAPKIVHMTRALRRLAGHRHLGDIRQQGLMIGIDLIQERKLNTAFSPSRFTGHQVCLEARNRGIIIRNLGDVIVLMPPLSITMDEIDNLVDATKYGMDAITL